MNPFVQSTKIGTHENKAIHSTYFGSLSFTMFTETVEDWLMISLDHESLKIVRYFTHVTHHCLHDAAGDQLPSFRKVGWRHYDVTAMLHQCCSESIVRFFLGTIFFSLNAIQEWSSAFDNRQKLPRVCQSYRENSNYLWRHFLHYDIIPLKVPFRLTGPICINIKTIDTCIS